MKVHEQLAQLQQQIATEKQKGVLQNREFVKQLEDQEATLQMQITNAQVEQNHEERVAESQQKFVYILDSLQVGGLTLRQLSAGDDAYELLYGKISQLFEVQAESYSALIKGYEEREMQVNRQNESLQMNNISLAEQLRESEDFRKDAESKRDAAGERIKELESENAQLKSWNDDLRQQHALGISGALRVIDPEALAKQAEEEQARIERIRAQKTIYDLKPDNDINPKNYTAKLAIDGSEVTFNWTQKNSFIVLDDETQVLSFRLQHAQSDIPNSTLDDITPPAFEDVTQEQFREGSDDVGESAESAHDGAGTDAEQVGIGNDTSVLGAEVEALKSTVDALTADVEALKRKVGWAA